MPTLPQPNLPVADERADAPLPGPWGGRLPLSTDGGIRFVLPEEISAIVACENYTEVHFDAGERVLVRRTLKAWLVLLAAEKFVRVHRRAIVNLDRIRGWQPLTDDTSLLTLDGCRQPVRVSYRYLSRSGLRAALKNSGPA